MKWLIYFILAGILLFAIGCSEKSVDNDMTTDQSDMAFMNNALLEPDDASALIPLNPAVACSLYYIFLSAEDSSIEVGGYSTLIFANVVVDSSYPANERYEILFEITAAPGGSGTHSPSFVYPPSDDSVLLEYQTYTNDDGIASVMLYSGIRAGHVRLKATYTYDETTNDSLFDEQTLITLESGPPARIDIAPSNLAIFDIGLQANITSATLLVWDQFTNPSNPNVPIYLEVIPDTIVWVEPETLFTEIEPLGQGYFQLIYECQNTFDTIRVIASTEDIADTSGPIILPIYHGQINVSANPETLFVAEPGTHEETEISARLVDGQGCYIHYGVIIFTVQVCGEISGQHVDTTDMDGYAYTEFRIWYEQIPESPPDPPNCIAKINAKLRGYPDVEGEVEIYCSRTN